MVKAHARIRRRRTGCTSRRADRCVYSPDTFCSVHSADRSSASRPDTARTTQSTRRLHVRAFYAYSIVHSVSTSTLKYFYMSTARMLRILRMLTWTATLYICKRMQRPSGWPVRVRTADLNEAQAHGHAVEDAAARARARNRPRRGPRVALLALAADVVRLPLENIKAGRQLHLRDRSQQF